MAIPKIYTQFIDGPLGLDLPIFGNKVLLQIPSPITPTPTPTASSAPATPTPTPTASSAPATPTPTPSPVIPGYLEADLYLNAVVSAGGIDIDSAVSGATRTMFNELFTQGLWTKLDAFWPFVGQVAAAHKFNAKNPVDTDDDFRLLFFGGWTHDDNGITPDGTTAYADTFYVPSSAATLTSASLGFYYSNTASTKTFPVEMGVGYFTQGMTLQAGMPNATQNVGTLWNGWTITGYANSAETGSLIISRTDESTLKLYRRGVLNYTTTGSLGTKADLTQALSIGAQTRVQNGDYINYSDRNLRFAFIGEGLDDTEAGNLDAIIQNYQIALGRATY